MANKDIKIIQENASSDFVLASLTPEAGKVLGFDSSLNLTNVTAGGGASDTVVALTSLNVDLSQGNWFNISISASGGFTMTNPSVKMNVCSVKNTAGSSITITMPTGHLAAQSTITIAAGKTRDFSLFYDGTYYHWQVSTEVSAI
jgi:hypothetical protein